MDNYQLKLETPWETVKEKLKEINYELTDEDLVYTPGEESLLLERLASRMGRTIPDIKAWIESVSANKDIAG